MINKNDNEEFSMASDLVHVQVSFDIHLWQVKSNKVKSLTNSGHLTFLEELLQFDINKFFIQMSLSQKNKEQNLELVLNEGFYYVVHDIKKAGFVPGSSWTKEVEEELILRNVITVRRIQQF